MPGRSRAVNTLLTFPGQFGTSRWSPQLDLDQVGDGKRRQRRAPMRSSTRAAYAKICRPSVTMPGSAKQPSADCNIAPRPPGWRSMPEPSTVLPAPPEEVYQRLMRRTRNTGTIRRRIDIFCRAIPDRDFAKAYRRDLLGIHRVWAAYLFPPGLPGATCSATALMAGQRQDRMAG